MVPPATDEIVAVYRFVEILMSFSGTKDRLGFWAVVRFLSGVCGGVLFFTKPSLFIWWGDKVSVCDSVSAGDGVSAGGDTSSIYLGVKINTKDIRKKARRVFLSILYLTGSLPPWDRGLHFNILKDMR